MRKNMERYFNILSFERDDHREKELESVIKSCVVRYNLKRVTNLKDYVGELHCEPYDCIVCDEDNLKDFEKKNTVKFAKEINPFATFIYLSSSEDKYFNNSNKLSHCLSRDNFKDAGPRILDSKLNSEVNNISSYWG